MPLGFIALLVGMVTVPLTLAVREHSAVGAIVVPLAALALLVFFKRSRSREVRAERRWNAKVATVERTEKIENLGHTLGGLSAVVEGESGMLSEAEDGHLSLAVDDRDPDSI